jgi:predicted transcriptional regulator
MTSDMPNLRLLDQALVSRELDLASELFHRINRIIPEEQKLLTVPAHCKVREAVRLMREHGYSQVPVVNNGEVLGVFSYRSLAIEASRSTLEEWNAHKCAPGDLNVDEFLEQFDFSRVTSEMHKVFDGMERDNGVLIGTPERLIGILTPMDFLRYLYRVASPFVLVSEIELALRALIRRAIPPEQSPPSLEEMTFGKYQRLVTNESTWPQFEPLLGGTRTRAFAKLEEVRTIRNNLFHFKCEMTIRDHEVLAGHRNWLLSKVKQADSHSKPESQP